MNVPTPEQARLDLFSDTCQCGNKKLRFKSFCRRCYLRLPLSLQRALYDLIGHGYEQAYANAMKVLNA